MADIPDLAKTELAIVARTNGFRKEQGLGAVRREPTLDRAAKSFARYLATSGKFAHEADGRTPAERVRAAGYWYCRIAENLALNLDSRGFTVERLARDVVEGWKASPGHRKNMLLPSVTEIGVGIAQASTTDPKFLSVQLLARPNSLAFEFTVTNKTAAPVAYRFAGKDQDIPARTIVTHKACEPGELAFRHAGNWPFRQTLSVRFPVAGKTAFELREGSGGKVSVIEQR